MTSRLKLPKWLSKPLCSVCSRLGRLILSRIKHHTKGCREWLRMVER